MSSRVRSRQYQTSHHYEQKSRPNGRKGSEHGGMSIEVDGGDQFQDPQGLLNVRKNHYGNPGRSNPLPSPKFNGGRLKTIESHPEGSKLQQLQSILEQVIRDSANESAEVRRGLAELRDHLQYGLIQSLERKTAKSKKTHHQKEHFEEGNTVDRFKELKLILEKILKDCQIQSEDVRKSLNHLRSLQDEVEEEVENIGEERVERRRAASQLPQQSRHIRNVKASRKHHREHTEGDIRDLAPELLITDSSQDQGDPVDERAQNLPTVQQQIDYLDDIQGRIFKQVMTLREDKLRLMAEVNSQIKNSNALVIQIKRLSKQLSRYRDPRDSLAQNQSIINRLAGQREGYKLQPEVPRLKEKIRKLQDELARAYDAVSKRQSTRDSGGTRGIIAKLEQALNASNRQNADLRNQLQDRLEQIRQLQQRRPSPRRADQSHSVVADLREHIRRLEDKNAQLQSNMSNYDSLQQSLAKLKQENEQLRVQTIRLLKKKDNTEFDTDKFRTKYEYGGKYTSDIDDMMQKYRDNQQNWGKSYANYVSSSSNYGYGSGGDYTGYTGYGEGTNYSTYETKRYTSTNPIQQIQNYESGLDDYKSALSNLRTANLDSY